MSFQEFCDKNKDIDQQTIEANNSFIIRFSKHGGSAFHIDPTDVVAFLKYFNEHHSEYIKIITDHELFNSDKTYLNYQEKPYRALYKNEVDDQRLKTISSMGGSQTKELTKVISKLICYLAEIEYDKIEDNTHYDKVSIEKALNNLPDNLTDLVWRNKNTINLKGVFEKWLVKKELSDRTVKSYAVTSVNFANHILSTELNSNKNIYSITSYMEIEAICDRLGGVAEWNDKNSSGNNMYIAALNKYTEFLKELFDLVYLPKPFLLLAGLSGTGKTRFVREQAQSNETYSLVSVRPDWHEPSDLLGYVSRLSGKPVYVSTKVLEFIIKAWRAVAPTADSQGTGELDLSVAPYWLCLDEMNLAPVEQYFADYLSVLESRKLRDGVYECEALLDASLLKYLKNNGGSPQKNLGLESNDELWKYFLEFGIGIPPNLIVAGTVNMDETTHGFSRKVIDRAFTFDFGEFFPNNYAHFFESDIKPVTFTYPHITQAKRDDLAGTVDSDGEKTIQFLEAVNRLLKSTPFELAYRALNELLLQVVCFNPQSDVELQAVWDDFLMSKVLPRIDGDEDKLTIKIDDEAKNLLTELAALLADELDEIWGGNRKDYYRVKKDGTDITGIDCRTRAKLEWMSGRLDVNTFTSFWP
ncbi:MAG: hypothetical protein QM500_10295 [Methylococcales bacterium]